LTVRTILQSKEQPAPITDALRIPNRRSNAPKPTPLARMQSTLGNQVLQRLLRCEVVQTKLTVNQPGHKFEQKADRMADTVMRMPDAAVPAERFGACGGKCAAQTMRVVVRGRT
jgi:hypothetical protein